MLRLPLKLPSLHPLPRTPWASHDFFLSATKKSRQTSLFSSRSLPYFFIDFRTFPFFFFSFYVIQFALCYTAELHVFFYLPNNKDYLTEDYIIHSDHFMTGTKQYAVTPTIWFSRDTFNCKWIFVKQIATPMRTRPLFSYSNCHPRPSALLFLAQPLNKQRTYLRMILTTCAGMTRRIFGSKLQCFLSFKYTEI